MTRVVHVKMVDWYQEGGDLIPVDNVVYIGRAVPKLFHASKWGNPFKLKRGAPDAARAECLAKYEAWLNNQPALVAALPELRGRVLACWCHPKMCHGDVLARLTDGPNLPHSRIANGSGPVYRCGRSSGCLFYAGHPGACQVPA